ncbi:SPP1 family prophage L54a [Staphylococcus saprophyticus]|uniref:phage holin n=1 Tax=Staphylococcus saprophyticus TaxID=29385 RepID=UPI000E0396B8|nr:phage holin [Staphylococcus saprophyticus]SUM62990.1 SPP1 family prophage L54a [Staphylococcus saprophyticus]
MNITKGTAVRILALILALINQQLTKHGISPIPSDDQMLSDIVVWIITAYTAYKDNPITKEGKQANDKLKELKYENKQPTNGKAPSDFDADKDGQI